LTCILSGLGFKNNKILRVFRMTNLFLVLTCGIIGGLGFKNNKVFKVSTMTFSFIHQRGVV